MKLENTLVIGCDGHLGSAVTKYLKEHDQIVTGTTRRTAHVSYDTWFLDLAEPVMDFPPQHFKHIFLCAAQHNVWECEHNIAATRRVNLRAPMQFLRKVMKEDTFLVFPSTNQVFDGREPYRPETDSVCPVTEYGKQKARAESDFLQAFPGQVAVVRFAKVLTNDRLFQKWKIMLLRGEPIQPLNDMKMAPVSKGFAARVLMAVAQPRSAGIFQISATSEVTYDEVAFALAEKLGVDRYLVQPIAAGEVGVLPEMNPENTTLNSDKATSELGLQIPDVWDTINDMLDALAGVDHCYNYA